MTNEETIKLSMRVQELEEAIRWLVNVRLSSYTVDQYGKGEMKKLISDEKPSSKRIF